MRRFQIKENQENKYHVNNVDNSHMDGDFIDLCFSSPSNSFFDKFNSESSLLNDIDNIPIKKQKIRCAESQAHRQVRNKQKKLVDETCMYLKKRLHEKHMLDEVAYAMGTNRSKLASSFKSIKGKGVFEWLRERRMIKAKAILLITDLSIQQVSFEVGFDNCANFSTAYKKHFGISPRQQRTLNIFF
jgi:transcriptional regulator GlxA family with amidase domain